MRKRFPIWGDERVVERFLLLPRTLPVGPTNDAPKERRWLEKGRIVEWYEPLNHRIGEPCFWIPQYWAIDSTGGVDDGMESKSWRSRGA